MASGVGTTAWTITLGAIFGLWIHNTAWAICGNEPGDFKVYLETHARSGALDADDSVTIDASPAYPNKVTRMVALFNGDPHPYPLPHSDTSSLTVTIEPIEGTRKLGFAGHPLNAGVTTLEINAFDNQGHCGYGALKGDLHVRAAEDDFAIVIGVNSTIASPRPLLHARADAYEIAKYLISDLKFNAHNIWLLTDDKAEAALAVPGTRPLSLDSVDVITNAFTEIGDSISYLSALYFYFSGHQFVLDTHNADADHFFLMLPNSTLDEDSVSRWPWRRLSQKLQGLSHLDHGVVILDSCYSGGPQSALAIYQDQDGPNPTGMKVIGAMHVTHLTRDPLPETVGLLASSIKTQPSWELRTRPHGAFTQALIDVAQAAKAAHIKLSLVEALDGKGGLVGASQLTATYVSADYGASTLQTPTPVGETLWMKQSGTWVP